MLRHFLIVKYIELFLALKRGMQDVFLWYKNSCAFSRTFHLGWKVWLLCWAN